MNKSRKQKAFRPGGYDSLEERVVLSTGGEARRQFAEQLREVSAAADDDTPRRAQLRNRPFGRRGQLGRRQFALRGSRGGGNGAPGLGANALGFNPVVSALGFTDPTATAAALTATNTASSVVGPNLTADASGFINPGLTATNLAQAVAAGSTINSLSLNSGASNFNGTALGNGLFSNGLGFISTQSLLGNLAGTIDPSLNLTPSLLNGTVTTFGGLGANNAFGLGLPNTGITPNTTGFNSGLGLRNGLGFPTTTPTTTIGTPLTNLTPFNVNR